MSELSSIETRFLHKYPWLPGGRDIFEPETVITDNSVDLNPLEYMSELLGGYFRSNKKLPIQLKQVFKYALEKRESGLIPSSDKLNILMYYIIKLLLTALNNRFLDNHMANFLSKIYYDKIKKENIRDIAKLSQYMGLDARLLDTPLLIDSMKFPFSVEYTSYIPIASMLKDTSWNLVNRYVDKGRVYLLTPNIVRLLQEKIRREVLPQRLGPTDELLKYLKQMKFFDEIFSDIEEKLDLIKIQNRKFKKDSGDFSNDMGKPGYELYPPCVKSLLDKALDGVNLTHNERLHIAFFYANTEHTVEETVDVFRTLPDFSEEIARYNVEFSRGINGKGKKYSVYGCPKLKSLGICKADDKKFGDNICKNGVKKKGETSKKLIKSPHSFIFWKKVEINRRKWAEQQNFKDSRRNNSSQGGNTNNQSGNNKNQNVNSNNQNDTQGGNNNAKN